MSIFQMGGKGLRLFLIPLVLIACSPSTEVGRWQGLSENTVIEFTGTGQVSITDQSGGVVKGSYHYGDNGSIILELNETNILMDEFVKVEAEIVTANIVLDGDQMTLSFIEDNEVETFKRVR